jgi:hypothetical protein
MKIELILGAKIVKKRPYKLVHKYNTIIQKEIEAILVANIIYLIDNLYCKIPMVVQPKTYDPKNLQICVYLSGLNKITVMDPFPTPYVDEIINKVTGNAFYSFTDRFSNYNQVPIAKEDQEKTTFVSKFRPFAYRVMPFGLKTSLADFSRIVVK